MTFRRLTSEDLQQLPPKEKWEALGEWTIKPDREAAERFLTALDPSTLNFTFQFFDDNADRKRKDLTGFVHGSLAQHWDTLCRLNAQGAGIYVTINATDFKGRSAANIVRIRSLFIDLDKAGPLPEKFHAEPHIVVESSRDKYHVYWLVRDCPVDQFTALQIRLIAAYDSDAKPKDLSRVLRLPGFIHEKVKDGVRSLPFRSDLVEASDRPAYVVADAITGLPEKETTSAREKVEEKATPAAGAMPWTADEEARIRSALDAIPTDEATLKQEFGDSHEVWWKIGYAINRLGWGEQGLAIYRDWSKESPEYNEEGLLTAWRSFERHRDDGVSKPVTIGTVYFYARRFGWDSGASPDECAPTERNTDLGNARRLVRIHGNDLRYVHAWRAWLAWENGHWRRDVDLAIMRKAKDIIEHMYEEAGRINDETRRTALRGWAMKSQDGKRLREMVGLAQSEIKVVLPVSKLDADPYLLGVRNGVVDLRTGEFREARREDYVTKRAGTAFDPHARCPQWEAFLRRILGDAELIKYLQRAAGYLLTGLTVEEVLFVLWGTGANGKSTFRETLYALLGDYAVGSDASLLITPKQGGGPTPDLARLHGRRLVTVNETQQNDHLNEARVKFITSHDIITARNLYEAPFDFTPTHKTILTTNHKPIVRGGDEGTWRRIHLLPFTKMIPLKDRDPRFREWKLLPELAGILNWALEGLKAYREQGLCPPEAVRAATKEYREDMDIIGQWIEACCVLDPGAKVTASSLHYSYKCWADSEAGFSISANKFGRELRDERGFEKTRDERGKKAYRGLRLKRPEEG
jgi:putative DNA primase/helicase